MIRPMDRCDECGFVYEDHPLEGVANELGVVGERAAEGLQAHDDDAGLDRALRNRPEPAVWSVLEYACHLRDIFLTQRERLFLALVEESPSFAPIHRDERAVLARYGAEERATVADELLVTSALLARSFAGVDAAGWQRTCLYNYPTLTQRTVGWLGRHTLHEGAHHLQDMDRVAERVGAAR